MQSAIIYKTKNSAVGEEHYDQLQIVKINIGSTSFDRVSDKKVREIKETLEKQR